MFDNWFKKLPGLALALIVAGCAHLLHQALFKQWGVSILVIAIILGSVAGHLLNNTKRAMLEPGLRLARGHILRFAIIFYGFNITFQQFSDVGLRGFLLAVTVVSIILALGIYAGKRWFKLDTELAILIAIGSAICGAAAVAAAEPILKTSPYKVAIAVATVVIFGTLSMFIYPLVAQWLVIGELHYGLWTGATVHEVAQVVVAGAAVSEQTGHIAVVEKMLRVTMLVPVLLLLSWWQALRFKKMHASVNAEGGALLGQITIPWFALLFLVAVACNSIALLPQNYVDSIIQIDTFLLTVAMAALGAMTHISVMKKAGAPSLGLASLLFATLLFGGYILTGVVLLQ